MQRDFLEELKNVIKKVDEPTFKYVDPPLTIELEGVVDALIEQPCGPLYALCRSTANGNKAVVFYGLTYAEATYKFEFYNKTESDKRKALELDRHEKGLEYMPESSELVFYDVIEQNKLEQRSPYYNPPLVIQGSSYA